MLGVDGRGAQHAWGHADRVRSSSSRLLGPAHIERGDGVQEEGAADAGAWLTEREEEVKGTERWDGVFRGRA